MKDTTRQLSQALLEEEDSYVPGKVCPAENTDHCDMDPQELSQQLLTPPRRRLGWLWLLLLAAGAAALYFLYQGGNLPWLP